VTEEALAHWALLRQNKERKKERKKEGRKERKQEKERKKERIKKDYIHHDATLHS
jgi:hypothetical protein